MKKRKQTVVNKKYQLKKTFRFIIGVSVIIIIIITSVGVILSVNNSAIKRNNDRLMQNIDRITQIMELQQNLYINLFIRPSESAPKLDQETANQAMFDYNYSIDTLKAAAESNNNLMKSNGRIIKSNNLLLLISILVFIVGIAVLFYRLLIHTHRVAGPISVMSRDIQKILDGQKPDLRDLREMDDFKEFHDLLRKLARKHMELEERCSITDP